VSSKKKIIEEERKGPQSCGSRMVRLVGLRGIGTGEQGDRQNG